MSRTAIVKAVESVTPNMLRITFEGPDLADFPAGHEGGYIKLIFPDLPRSNPNRPVMRTYSIRSHDAGAGEIAVDFAMHADTGGIAIEWAAGTKPGDEMEIGGPGSIKMAPPDADWYLVAGDMTALPAGLCNLEILPADAKGYAIFEITEEADKQDIALPEGFEVRWFVNPVPHEDKGVLLQAVKDVPWLDGAPFVWTACEFDTMRELRTYYRTERGVDKKALYLSSYWRAGRSEDQHKIDKRKDAKADAPAIQSIARGIVQKVRSIGSN